MRWLALVLALAACKTGSATGPADEISYSASTLADEDVYRPSYDRSDLQQALIAERAAEATAERRVAELEQKGDYDTRRVAREDLAVRRRFIASLEACEASGRVCPPRLDDPAWTFDVEGDAPPKLETHLRFDLESWRKVAAEMHGRACACRTLACVDSVGVAIDQLETRPMPDVQGDEAASVSITWARECLYRLRGKKPTPRVARD